MPVTDEMQQAPDYEKNKERKKTMTVVPQLRSTRPCLFLFLLGVFLVSGCTGSNSDPGATLIDTQGNHPPGFLATHPSFALANVTQCTSCHGSDLTGGIAKVGCFTSACHHGTIPTWAQPTVHGASAKKAPGNSGFASCQICHGSNFSGGGAGVACASCHGVSAPHPAKPWRIAGATDFTHTNVDQANAPVCAGCHFSGSVNNPAGHPSTPAPAGTPPGCFNSTLCHGTSTAPHILGATWRNPTSAAFHGPTAKSDLIFCQGCHGTTGTVFFDGGTAPTACSACHSAAKAHPTTWYGAPSPFPGYMASHRDAGNRSTACAVCHSVTAPGAGPMAGAPSCFTASFTNADGVAASCHANGPGVASHAVPFFDTTHFQTTAITFTGNCSNCHAVEASSPLSTAPLCTVCHAADSPLTALNCTSCHAAPPNGGAGAVYPNIAGNHAVHLALNSAGTPVTCDTCHNGLGTNTLNHYNRANARPGLNALRVSPGDAAFLTTYNAETGASSFDNSVALSCANVSCHGGQATPNWQTGTLDVNTQCTSCHALGTAQFNSYNSGDHNRSQHVAVACTVCHNTTALAVNHFTNLSTQAMEGPASATIGGAGTLIGAYDPVTRSCTPFCHGNETW